MVSQQNFTCIKAVFHAKRSLDVSPLYKGDKGHATWIFSILHP